MPHWLCSTSDRACTSTSSSCSRGMLWHVQVVSSHCDVSPTPHRQRGPEVGCTPLFGPESFVTLFWLLSWLSVLVGEPLSLWWGVSTAPWCRVSAVTRKTSIHQTIKIIRLSQSGDRSLRKLNAGAERSNLTRADQISEAPNKRRCKSSRLWLSEG